MEKYNVETMKKRAMIISGVIIAILIVIKIVWVYTFTKDNGTFEDEKKDILERRNYLVEKVVTSPYRLLDEMPSGIGEQFQGEWALYSCSMLTAALVNIAELYPETEEDALQQIDELIYIASSYEMRQYDRMRWGEDPLETLNGDERHISYLSHLAWMISGYKQIGGDDKYDTLYKSLCGTMNRRILQSPTLNLPTYPDECIYVPDMLVAIVALANYSRQNNGEYSSTVEKWVQKAKSDWIDEETGMLESFLPLDSSEADWQFSVKGSYSALNCYYLTMVDSVFAKEQYAKLKENFLQEILLTGFKEYSDWFFPIGLDIDAGPIIFNLSPSGTAFAVGSATYFEDTKVRNGLLKTAEIFGTTISWHKGRHYWLANLAIVGEAIMLAMRTNTPGTLMEPPLASLR